MLKFQLQTKQKLQNKKEMKMCNQIKRPRGTLHFNKVNYTFIVWYVFPGIISFVSSFHFPSEMENKKLEDNSEKYNDKIFFGI